MSYDYVLKGVGPWAGTNGVKVEEAVKDAKMSESRDPRILGGGLLLTKLVADKVTRWEFLGNTTGTNVWQATVRSPTLPIPSHSICPVLPSPFLTRWMLTKAAVAHHDQHPPQDGQAHPPHPRCAQRFHVQEQEAQGQRDESCWDPGGGAGRCWGGRC